MCYLSFCNSTSQKAQDYPEKDGEWLTRYPPLGETIRKTYLEAANSIWNPWRISDKDRHTRQTPAVKCETSFAQDHIAHAAQQLCRHKGFWLLATCQF